MPNITAKTEPLDEEQSASEDYTIYLASDEYRSTPSWIFKDYEGAGVLSADQKRHISERYNLPADLTDELSIYVGNCLDVKTLASFYALTKSSAIERGQRTVRKALRYLKAGKSDDEVRPYLADISSVFSQKMDSHDAASLIADKTLDLRSTLEKLMQIPDALASTAPDDKRKIHDYRRILIVENCCYVWLDAGHQVTYTTFPANKPGDRRGGKLFELINEVTEMVTRHSERIPEETLRADVDALVKKHGWNLPEEERPDFMKEPPEFGKTD